MAASVSRKDVSKALGLSIRQVYRLFEEGIFPKQNGRVIELHEYVAAYVSHKTGREGEVDLTRERALLAISQREKCDLEVAVKRGELVSVDRAVNAWGSTVVAARAKFLAMPTKLAPLVMTATTTEEVQELISDAINEALDELAEPDLSTLEVDTESVGTGEAATETDSQPVGRPEKAVEPRGKRRARKVADKQG